MSGFSADHLTKFKNRSRTFFSSSFFRCLEKTDYIWNGQRAIFAESLGPSKKKVTSAIIIPVPSVQTQSVPRILVPLAMAIAHHWPFIYMWITIIFFVFLLSLEISDYIIEAFPDILCIWVLFESELKGFEAYFVTRINMLWNHFEKISVNDKVVWWER